MKSLIKHCIKSSLALAFTLISMVFTFTTESLYESIVWISQKTLNSFNLLSRFKAEDINITISRFVCFIIIWSVILMFYVICVWIHGKIVIKGHNYSISIEYGDILETTNCKRVIPFDECFTTTVGNRIGDINSTSICGQYLKSHPDLDIKQLISSADVIYDRGKSRYENKTRYKSGTIVPNEDDLLLAFAKLDARGKGHFPTRNEYLDCLNKIWQEIEYHYSEKDVCIPILGAGTTVFEGNSGASYTQQELLDMIILSYKLSSHKIKSPHKLRIICKRNKDFSIYDIDG